MDTHDNQRITLTEKEICKRLGISRITAYRLRNAGKLSHCRIGNQVVYLERHLEEFLNASEHKAQDKQEA